MDLSLNKLPWYAQVGLFVALAVAGVAAFYYLYAVPAEQALEVQRKRLAALRVDISQGMAIAQQLPQFRAQVADLEARLDGLQGHPARREGLRRPAPQSADAGGAVEPDHQASSSPAPVVTKELHAEWPINIELDGTYHNLGLFFDRISRFSRIINIGNIVDQGQGQARAEHERRGGLRGHDVRAGRGREERRAAAAKAPAAARPAARAPGGKS